MKKEKIASPLLPSFFSWFTFEFLCFCCFLFCFVVVFLIIYCTVYFSTYVAIVGTLTGNQRSVTIGTGQSTQSGSTTYVDQTLNGNTDYFVIVRVFSMIDASVRTNKKDN